MSIKNVFKAFVIATAIMTIGVSCDSDKSSLAMAKSAVEATSEETVIVTQTGSCYHRTENCPSLSRSRNLKYESESEASSHLRRCSKCW